MSNHQQQIDKLEERIVDLEDELYDARKLLTDLTEALRLMTDRLTEHTELFDGVYRIQNKTVDMITDIENRLNKRGI